MATIKVGEALFRYVPSLHRCVSTLTHINSVRSSHSVRPVNEVPGPTRTEAFLHFFPFTEDKMNNMHLYFRHLHEKYGKIVKVDRGRQHVVFLFDPEYINKVFMNEGKYPERFNVPLMEAYQQRTKKCLFNTLQGEDWYAIRAPVQEKIIKPVSVATYVPIQGKCADDLVTWLWLNHKQGAIYIKEPIMRYVVDANTALCFNRTLGFIDATYSKKDRKQDVLLEKISEIFTLIPKSLYTFPLFRYMRTPMYYRFESAMNHVLGTFEGYIKEEMEKLNSDEIKNDGTNLLHQLLMDKRLSLEHVVTVMCAVLFGGVEMTTNTLMWFLWILGKNEDKQELLYKEIQDTFGNDGPVTASKLGHMPYLKACIKESYRCVFPVVSGSMRILPQDLEVGGYLLPKGTDVHFGHNTLSSSTEYFESPDDYIPERWSSVNNSPEKLRLMSLCVLPFGRGKRNCVGRRFAEQETQIAVIKILQKFKVSLAPDMRSVGRSYTVLAVPHKPLQLIFTPRLRNK